MRVNDEDCENRFCIGESNATGDITYPLAYLVERAENCTNCGKYEECGYMQATSRFASLNRCDDYKPKTEQKAEKHYRPFKDTDELIKVWDAKCPNKRPVGMTMPLIWVRDPKRPKCTYLLNGLMGNEVHWGSYIFNMQELFDNFEFLDGTPCGVKN